jgi:hypothetical protein
LWLANFRAPLRCKDAPRREQLELLKLAEKFGGEEGISHERSRENISQTEQRNKFLPVFPCPTRNLAFWLYFDLACPSFAK